MPEESVESCRKEAIPLKLHIDGCPLNGWFFCADFCTENWALWVFSLDFCAPLLQSGIKA